MEMERFGISVSVRHAVHEVVKQTAELAWLVAAERDTWPGASEDAAVRKGARARKVLSRD